MPEMPVAVIACSRERRSTQPQFNVVKTKGPSTRQTEPSKVVYPSTQFFVQSFPPSTSSIGLLLIHCDDKLMTGPSIYSKVRRWRGNVLIFLPKTDVVTSGSRPPRIGLAKVPVITMKDRSSCALRSRLFPKKFMGQNPNAVRGLVDFVFFAQFLANKKSSRSFDVTLSSCTARRCECRSQITPSSQPCSPIGQ